MKQLDGSANKVPGYGLMNARLTFETGDGKWNLALSVENLLDKFYWYTLGPSVALSLDCLPDNRTGSPGRGREAALTLYAELQVTGECESGRRGRGLTPS